MSRATAASGSSTSTGGGVLTGQIVDLRARLLRSLVRDAVELLHVRETTKSSLLRLGGEERPVIREFAPAHRAP